MSRRLRLASALSALAMTACSSFGIAIESSRPEETVATLKSVFVLVGSATDLIPVDPKADALDLLETDRQPRYVAVLQFEPYKDPKGRLGWKQIHSAGSSPKRVEVDLAPLSVELDSDLVKDRNDTTIVVLSLLQNGTVRKDVLRHDELLETKSFVFDFDGRGLTRR